MNPMQSLSLHYDGKQLWLLDQQLLPHLEKWIDATEPQAMFDAIKALKVRGAPLIGVASAVCLAHLAQSGVSESEFKKNAEMLRSARPTAVNLMVAIDRLLAVTPYDPEKIVMVAEQFFAEDTELCERIAENGSRLIDDGDSVITHCNTGGLATAGVGTALGVLKKADEQNKRLHVYVDETRPLLQGGRLTTWELEKLEIPYTLICDNMAGTLMSQGKVTKAIVGADRIAVNGDFANKVGTYSLAVLCHYHRIPFYTAAPFTTIDPDCESGKQIPVEERSIYEVQGVSGQFGEVKWAPAESQAYNPAFDVTPAELVSAWILDNGVFNQAEFSGLDFKSRLGRS